jgi:hypothetical protein
MGRGIPLNRRAVGGPYAQGLSPDQDFMTDRFNQFWAFIVGSLQTASPIPMGPLASEAEC